MSIKVIQSNYIPFKGFVAINLFGVVFVRKDYKFKHSIEYKQMLVHEGIHTKQMQELLYLPFYVWYLLEWLIRLVMYRDRHKAYRNISFEREAYANQHKWDYPQERKRYAFLKYIKEYEQRN